MRTFSSSLWALSIKSQRGPHGPLGPLFIEGTCDRTADYSFYLGKFVLPRYVALFIFLKFNPCKVIIV